MIIVIIIIMTRWVINTLMTIKLKLYKVIQSNLWFYTDDGFKGKLWYNYSSFLTRYGKKYMSYEININKQILSYA